MKLPLHFSPSKGVLHLVSTVIEISSFQKSVLFRYISYIP